MGIGEMGHSVAQTDIFTYKTIHVENEHFRWVISEEDDTMLNIQYQEPNSVSVIVGPRQWENRGDATNIAHEYLPAFIKALQEFLPKDK